ncbi:MAG: hypothetical protein AB8G86_05410, partial [Saprospiraceae bacterium]
MEKSQSYNQPPIPPPYYEDDEITLKELILKIQEFWWEAWNNKGKIIGIAALLAGVFVFRTFFQKTTYTSSLTFLVSGGNEKGGKDELAILLGYGNFNFQLDKIVELARSRRVLNEVLFREVMVDDNKDYLANHLIKIY